jgi:hypothetical protein
MVAVVVSARAESMLEHAWRAQAMLGPRTWSRVIRIENNARGTSSYPAAVDALVFEFAGRLWFYCALDGTQSFSMYAGQLDRDKNDFAPLLRDIDSGFARWQLMPADRVGVGPLANGCFIESLAECWSRIDQGIAVAEPQLLSFYVGRGAMRRGHTVLTYVQNGRTVVFDPALPNRALSFPGAVAQDPTALAQAVAGMGVAKAVLLAIPRSDVAGGAEIAGSTSDRPAVAA